MRLIDECVCLGNQSFGGRSQLGSAVAASMNVSGAAEALPESAYKLEHEHLYYQVRLKSDSEERK
jgi:hypothetical protein